MKGKEGGQAGGRGVGGVAMQKVNCWSEVFIGSAGGREYALKTTVCDFNCREGNLAFFPSRPHATGLRRRYRSATRRCHLQHLCVFFPFVLDLLLLFLHSHQEEDQL